MACTYYLKALEPKTPYELQYLVFETICMLSLKYGLFLFYGTYLWTAYYGVFFDDVAIRCNRRHVARRARRPRSVGAGARFPEMCTF